jgi:hypothetical protein
VGHTPLRPRSATPARSGPPRPFRWALHRLSADKTPLTGGRID